MFIHRFPAVLTGILGTSFMVLILFWVFGLHTVIVNPGHELVINDKPYMFGHSGVRDEPIKEGRKWLFVTSTAQDVVMLPQSTSIVVDDFSSKNNILLDFETTIQWRILDSVLLAKNFGVENWLQNNLKNQYLAIVRDVVKQYTMEQMMSDPTTAASVDNEVTTRVRELVTMEKLPILVMNVSLGRAKPNEKVLMQMNETAQQEQRLRTLTAATLAEGQRALEQAAKASADNAYRNAMQMSPEQYLQMEYIHRFSEACKTSTCVIGQPGMGLTLSNK